MVVMGRSLAFELIWFMGGGTNMGKMWLNQGARMEQTEPFLSPEVVV